jgi:hypothetical protein
MTGKNRIMIFGPKDDGTYVVEFKTADGDVLAISIPRTEAHVIRHFQRPMRNFAVLNKPSLGSITQRNTPPFAGVKEGILASASIDAWTIRHP